MADCGGGSSECCTVGLVVAVLAHASHYQAPDPCLYLFDFPLLALNGS